VLLAPVEYLLTFTPPTLLPEYLYTVPLALVFDFPDVDDTTLYLPVENIPPRLYTTEFPLALMTFTLAISGLSAGAEPLKVRVFAVRESFFNATL
jgi:hypothetical protein